MIIDGIVLLAAIAGLLPVLSEGRQLGSVLALFPLSGTESLRGDAQLAGVRVALDDTDIDDHVTIHHNDSKCDLQREGSLVVSSLASSGQRLVVLGGGCVNTADTAQTHCDPNNVIHRHAPQVLFEESVQPAADAVTSLGLFNVRYAVTSSHDAIIAFIKANRWRKVAILHSSHGIHRQGSQAFQAISGRRGIEIPLLANANDGRIWDILKSSRLKVVVLYLDNSSLKHFICSVNNTLTSHLSRYTWLLPSLRDATSLSNDRLSCNGHVLHNVFSFEAGYPFTGSQKFKDFSKKLLNKYPNLQDVHLQVDAAYAYDATYALLTSLRRINHGSADAFAANVIQELSGINIDSVTGNLAFHLNGRRAVNITIHRFQNLVFTNVGKFEKRLDLARNLTIPVSQNSISTSADLKGIPLFVLILMSALSLVGIAFAIALLVFNIMKQKDRIIKMTSPNINVLILFGAMLGYLSVIILAPDSQLISLSSMASLHQAATYTIAIGFTLVYGSAFAKSWRVYIIFNNLQFNGKTTRDEHLIVLVLLLVLVDLMLLLPWTIADPLICTRVVTTETYQPDSDSDVIQQIDVCTCKFYPLWICLLYVFKALILGVGFYFTWQTRHVTLPALRDTHFVYVIIYSVVSFAVLLLPIILISSVGLQIKYITGSMVILLLTTVTICLLFVPKVQLYRKNKCKATSNLVQFLFSESLRKTQETKSQGCFGKCFSLKEDDPYAQEVYATEIENLKKTIKEKDASIRELTDRLFFGTEKFQEYLRTPKHHMRLTPTRHTPSSTARYQRGYYSDPDTPEIYRRSRPVSFTNSSHLQQESANCVASTWKENRARELPIKEPVRTNLAARSKAPGTQLAHVHHNRINFRKDKRASSPNHDSAIDNSSPSSISSDKEFPDILEQPDFEMDVFDERNTGEFNVSYPAQRQKSRGVQPLTQPVVKVQYDPRRTENLCFSEI